MIYNGTYAFFFFPFSLFILYISLLFAFLFALFFTFTLSFRLSDFGLSRFAGDDNFCAGCGTLAYSAPERFCNNMCFASDLWSLGVVLFETFSDGQRPFGGVTEAQLLLEYDRPTRRLPPRGCPSDIEELIYDMLERDAAQRPTAAQARARAEAAFAAFSAAADLESGAEDDDAAAESASQATTLSISPQSTAVSASASPSWVSMSYSLSNVAQLLDDAAAFPKRKMSTGDETRSRTASLSATQPAEMPLVRRSYSAGGKGIARSLPPALDPSYLLALMRGSRSGSFNSAASDEGD